MAGAEAARLAEDAGRAKNWKRWGPYLAERQWGTVREDYSADGDCWDYFPHDHARSRAYRWGEDGLLGITDREGRLCFAPGALERAGSHPQGTALRPDRARGQPRRRRQGALLLPGLHADPFLHQGALQVSRRPSSRTAAGRGEPAAGQGRAGVRAGRHRRVRRGPLLRRHRRVRQGRRPTTSSSASPWRTAGPTRHRCTCCRRSGSATPGAGAGEGEGYSPRAEHPPRGPGPARRRARDPRPLRASRWTRRVGRPARAAVHRERDQLRAPVRRAQPAAVRQGRVPRLRHPRRRRRGEPRRRRAPRPPSTTARRPGGREPSCVSGFVPRDDVPASRSAPPSRHLRPAHARGRRVLRDARCPEARRTTSGGAPPGVRRPAVVASSSTTTS